MSDVSEVTVDTSSRRYRQWAGVRVRRTGRFKTTPAEVDTGRMLPFGIMRMRAVSLIVTLLLNLSAVAAEPAVQRFSAGLEQSSWTVSQERGACRLEHDVPRFGVARFEQLSGRRLEFVLAALQPPVVAETARLVSRAPAWKPGFPDRDLGAVRLEAGQTPLRVPRTLALRLYYELEQGMSPTLVFNDWGDGHDRVEVSLLPVRFREAQIGFAACTDGLVYLDFEPLTEDQVFFDTDSAYLTRATRRALDKVAANQRKDKSVRVVLGGHADERGGTDYNLALSRRRAEEVARYLRLRGVSGQAIETRYFGETQPAGDGSGAATWARDRRVTVWLAARQ